MDSLSGLTKLVYDTNILGKKSSSGNPVSSTNPPSASVEGDLVNISPDNVLDYIKGQATDLKNSLPSIITNSLLQPVSDSVISQDPLNALLNQFVNPTQAFLSSKVSNNFSPEQMKSLQQEIAGLKNYLPTMMANTLLGPLQNTGSPLDGILQSMSNQLGDLASQVQQKAQV